jgi:AcrR family transcriptional regulator
MPRTGLTSEQLKERAIDCAVTQVQQVGFHRVKLSDIAKALGVSHAALYGHFADKSALFDAVTERWLAKFDAEQEALCELEENRDALKRLVQWFVQLHRMKVMKVKHEPELFKGLNYSSEGEKPFVKAHISTMRRQLRTIISQAVDSNLIKPRTVDDIVSLLLDATVGFHHPAMVVLYVGEDREQQLRHLLETLIKGLRE